MSGSVALSARGAVGAASRALLVVLPVLLLGALVGAVAACGSGGGAGGVDGVAAEGTRAAGPPAGAESCFPSGIAAGAPDARPRAADAPPLQVAATVAPITSIIANVAGDRARVAGVIPEGEDSHTFEPKPSAARALASADVVFVNGLQLEDPTTELAEANRRPDALLVELGTRTVRPDQYLFDFSFPREAGKPNPHLWTNPPMARCYAAIAAAVLGDADPSNAAAYAENARRYEARLDDLDRRMRTATASLPEAHRTLLTYHDAYAYFAAHYGWRVIGAIQVASFREPTPKEVTALIEQVRASGVPAIFGSEVFPSPVLEQIGRETGVRYVDTLRDDDLPGAPGDRDHSLLGLLRQDFATMVSALGGDASAVQGFDPADVVTDTAAYPQ